VLQMRDTKSFWLCSSSPTWHSEVALARARTIDEYRDALESSLEEAVRLSDLISNLLFLARTEKSAYPPAA
jgi:signal transduction histidine kinase